jgi:hypothetical protein
MRNKTGNTRSRIAALTVATATLVSLGGVANSASASDAVVDARGSASANCTGATRFAMNNTGSNVESTYTAVIAGKQPRMITVPAGRKQVVFVQGANGAKYALWGPDDVRLDHGTIPAQCQDGSPRGHITVSCYGVARFHLDTTDRTADVAFYLQYGPHAAINVPLTPGQQIVKTRRHLAAGTRVKLSVLGLVVDAKRIPAACTK